jgi:pyridoxine 5-phosphate synthase
LTISRPFAKPEAGPIRILAAGPRRTPGADGLAVFAKIGGIFQDWTHALREIVTKLDLKWPPMTMVKIALTVKPDLVTLVLKTTEPTEGGLDVAGMKERLQTTVSMLHDAGIPVSLFIEPDLNQIKAAHKISADFVELHTGRYANATKSKEADAEFDAITQAAKLAYKLGMGVNAGHGLNYRNVARLIHIPEIVEYNIGHSIIARAVLVGLDQAVKEMKALLS